MDTRIFLLPDTSMKNTAAIQLLALLLLLPYTRVAGTFFEDLLQKHAEYKENCTRTLATTRHTVTGFSGNVYKICTANGTWKTEENSSVVWQDKAECEDPGFFKHKEDEAFQNSVLRILSIVGYMLSLSSLILAMIIMASLRKLHCTRNYIHMNLFVSFMLRAMAVVTKEIVIYVTHSNKPNDEAGWNDYLDSTKDLLCKVSEVAMQYFVACNYFWLLLEAIFLHTLLFTAVLTKRRLLKRYMLVIFCIFLRIIKLLLSKLQADQLRFTDYRYSLARAILVLIPLLGIHEILFMILIDETIEGNHRYVRNFINLTLNSFQGFLVAVLYCFANGEVRTELKNRWNMFVSNYMEDHNCFSRMHPKYFWKRSWKGKGHPADHSDSYEERSHVPTQTQLTQVTIKSGVEPSCEQCPDTRKSMSSSYGDMTFGETMEEILEESQF
ncbi:Glucagon-like peptide 2 receptor [Bagarius yarrelli]|uniref:Glucagon-like peptide 2 receptor n=1 Tax=Bagarius yarrelli TaxID=175774 RepID=A0A556TIN2_BAGYA|nr:Glucagon-like peptide 2 receptor [Bagarius yarrelli]